MRSGGAGAGASTLVPRVSLDDYVANLRAIAATAQGCRAAVLVVGPVYRDTTTVPDEAARMTAYRRDLAAALGADGTAYLEIPELTETGAPGNADLFVEHIHPNEAGHRRLAEAIAHALIDRGLLSHR
jgi:lysophospholipase L1-like esterase